MTESTDRPSTAATVSPDPAVLEANLELLERRHPATVRAIEGVEPYPDDTIEPSRSGAWTISAPPVDGSACEDPDGAPGRRLLHSRFRPREEAQRALPESWAELDVLAFMGAGLGYGPLAAADQLTSENMLLWIESDARLFRTALAWVDLRPVLEHRGTRLWVGCDPTEVHERLRAEVTRILSGNFHVISHPPSIQREPDAYQAYSNAIQNFANEGAVNVRTTFYLSRFSARNQAGNLGPYAVSPGIDFLRDALRGQPAVLVAAGPSLRRNFELLRELEGRVTTIAVSTALRPVVEQGIRPDFTALIDYHRMSKRYFEGLDPALEIPIVCDTKATDAAVAAHSGIALFGNDLILNTMFDGLFGDRGPPAQGSTVAHVAFQFLSWLGADPIVLVGQDLSYPGGLIHVPGTAIQAQEYPSSHRFYSLEMRELEYYFVSRKKFRPVPRTPLPGQAPDEQSTVPTDEVFFTYIQEFERMFAGHRGTVLNATEGGAQLRGTEPIALADFVRDHRDHVRPDFRTIVRDAAASVSQAERKETALSLLADRRRELRSLKSIYDRILKRLSRVIRANESGQPADEIVLEVHKLHDKAKAHGVIYLYLTYLAQADGWERIQADRRLEAGTATGVEKQLHQSRRDREYVKGLHQACDFAEDCFERARASLERLGSEVDGSSE